MLNNVQADMTKGTKKQPCDYSFYNMRAILIGCVVLGHLLEVCAPFFGYRFLYQIIYSFHMPVFVFITGYFARCNIKKILFNWLFPYFIFQIIFIAIERRMNNDIPYQLTEPYWHLWFLLACVFYQLLIPLYKTDSYRRQIFTLICATILALVVGFHKNIGYYLTLSRFFVFQPWFLLGYYFSKHPARQQDTVITGRKILRAGAVVVALCVCLFVIFISKVSSTALYGAFSYEKLPRDLIYRVICMGTAFVWIVFFVKILRPLINRKIPLITTLGQNTFSVYILHGFLIKTNIIGLPSLLTSPIYVVLVTVMILFLFGNSFVGRAFRFLFSERILKIFSKKARIGS